MIGVTPQRSYLQGTAPVGTGRPEAGSPGGSATERHGHQARTAEFIIVLAGAARGRGLATEATLLTLDYGFHVTALRMIWLKVLEPNTAGIRAYTSAGFKPAGRLRQSGYWLGEVCAELIMDALKEDFQGRCAIGGVG